MIRTTKHLTYTFLAAVIAGWLAMGTWLADHPEATGRARAQIVESVAGAEAVTP